MKGGGMHMGALIGGIFLLMLCAFWKISVIV